MSEVAEITSERELRELVGEPNDHALHKVRDRLHDLDRQWPACSPFCYVATSDAEGRCDVSPKGDPAGFTLVLDDTTIAIPDRPGNKRVDGFRNILANPRVGLDHVVPGRGDTLRVNGRARIVPDAPPSRARIAKGVEVPDTPLEQLEEHYGPRYGDRLYG
ncbi:pyridoxamine 5'-phosphate oxidase family protein [Streptomyces rimosus]|uniref:pyridoxamine 5'-phosphate oxidase family protein n=1 Tax=Streptomyces rimosus TaxID=1927 RepID=UPI0031DCEB38